MHLHLFNKRHNMVFTIRNYFNDSPFTIFQIAYPHDSSWVQINVCYKICSLYVKLQVSSFLTTTAIYFHQHKGKWLLFVLPIRPFEMSKLCKITLWTKAIHQLFQVCQVGSSIMAIFLPTTAVCYAGLMCNVAIYFNGIPVSSLLFLVLKPQYWIPNIVINILAMITITIITTMIIMMI